MVRGERLLLTVVLKLSYIIIMSKNKLLAKLGVDGRILLPASLRKSLSLDPGAELLIREEGGAIIVESKKKALMDAKSVAKKFKTKSLMSRELIQDRRKEDD